MRVIIAIVEAAVRSMVRFLRPSIGQEPDHAICGLFLALSANQGAVGLRVLLERVAEMEVFLRIPSEEVALALRSHLNVRSSGAGDQRSMQTGPGRAA